MKPTDQEQELTLTKPLSMPTIKPITTELAQVPKDYLLSESELRAWANLQPTQETNITNKNT